MGGANIKMRANPPSQVQVLMNGARNSTAEILSRLCCVVPSRHGDGMVAVRGEWHQLPNSLT